MRFVATCCALLAALILGGGLTAGEKGRPMPKVGDKAPEFQSVDENGKTWKSSDHVGKKIVVVYFYPADFTGGCTAQACGFRDSMDSLAGKGLEVVGVSGDSAATHKLFKAHHKLPFTLLADEKGELAKQFGVPVGKGGMSPTIDESGTKGSAPRGVTIQRYTVVIDRGGNVAALYKVDSAGGDAKKIGEIVQKLETK
jgi:thioredoxin-dependent peroxiredoxin